MKTLLAILFMVVMLVVSGVSALIGWACSTTYPVQVTFDFDYAGKHFETSYLTTVHRGPGIPEVSFFRYTHVRDRMSFKLPDDSLVILRPDWPSELGEGFERGRKYLSKARWFWLDNVADPTQLIAGWSGTRPAVLPGRPGAFSTIDVTATIERLNGAELEDAERADKLRDATDKIQNFSDWDFKGTLFTSVRLKPIAAVTPVAQAKLDQLRGNPGWLVASGSCRYRALVNKDLKELRGALNYSDSIVLLQDGNTWTTAGGPRPGGPIVAYSTRRQIEKRHSPHDDSFSIASLRPLALEMVRAVAWDGVTCNGIQAPSDAHALAVQFDDAKIAIIDPMDFIAVVAN